jgi:hypothetical protein
MSKRKRAQMVETDFKLLDKLNKDTKRVNDLEMLLDIKKKNHPLAKRYQQNAEVLLRDLERKAIDAEIAGDRFSQGYYENYAKKLRDALLKFRQP